MENRKIIPFKCDICGTEIGSPPNMPKGGRLLICDICKQVICPKCSIKIKKKIYCNNCNPKENDMKIILDTNVIISGIFFSGPPSQILEAWRDGKFKLVLSQQILI